MAVGDLHLTGIVEVGRQVHGRGESVADPDRAAPAGGGGTAQNSRLRTSGLRDLSENGHGELLGGCRGARNQDDQVISGRVNTVGRTMLTAAPATNRSAQETAHQVMMQDAFHFRYGASGCVERPTER
ncbi:hypothetical protein Ait01nite_016030 [Actinoplanes italicus]|uniref:hypothetical protein n=1 Tax=Actinoplanes italicus TaxID=113567 RepID=UPI0011B26AE1|nr:hypothetical protein [Actinoplanes italicus]GIE28558.1 hypothetical protein Ait01nite_016030 [Actinoplanes italicus]